VITAALAMIRDESQRNELADFYERHKDRFFDIAFSRLHNNEDAEDAVQEAFVRIVTNGINLFEMPYADRVRFVDGIIRHISIDKFNKRSKTKFVSLDEIDDNMASDAISPEEKYITDFSANELAKFTLTLPQSQRQALFMYVHYKLSYSEISKILGISESLARKRVSNARKAIKRFTERNK